jgi:L-aminopeptidase/D-esterase-like protein
MIKRTARVFGSLLQGDAAIRLSQNERLMQVLTEALSMSMTVRHMIDTQIRTTLERAERLAVMEAKLDALMQRVEALEQAQSSKASL